jgi:hypothetical protein
MREIRLSGLVGGEESSLFPYPNQENKTEPDGSASGKHNDPNQVSQARTHPAGSFSLLTNVCARHGARLVG